MKFKQFINESSRFDLDQFREDTQFFFDQITPGTGFLKHGTRMLPTNFAINTFREREGPRDSPNSLHNEVNALLKKKFGFPYRNGLFTSGKWTQAANYGPVGVVFPIGKFEWLCNSEIDDLTGNFEMRMDHIKHVDKELYYDTRSEMAIEQILQELNSSTTWYHNRDLESCIGFGTEIMIKCDKFYIMDQNGDAYRQVQEYREELSREETKRRWEEHNKAVEAKKQNADK